MNYIDNFLNKITMYRIVLYVLISFFAFSVVLSIFKFLPYTPIDLISSLIMILFISWISNIIFAYVYDAPTNIESVYITALILFFIITPAQGGVYSEFLPFAFWASVWAMASKYIFAIGRKHLFNPAAFAVILTAFTINQFASWWIGTLSMLPIVLIGGFLVIRKIRRADLLFSFIISALITVTIITVLKGSNIQTALFKTLANSAFFFFAFIMLTEPLTAPTTRWLRIIFGVIVGALFTPSLHIGGIYSSPELALVVGNIFAYLVSPKEKLFLKLKERINVGTDTYDFIFLKDRSFSFRPGQYMEWTLKHRDPDSRGNRRYFTLASSPTEPEIHLGVKFYPEPSSFKNHLLVLPIGGEIIAAQKSGDFVLPTNKDKELVFIAGGIGVTPFRSMIQYLLDKKQKRNITILYSNKKVSDISYKEVFDRAKKELGIKTIYSITDKGETNLGESMISGIIDARVIAKEVPDYTNKVFYISGPHGMVDAFENTLKSMGVPNSNIKIDFFPGFA
ncbi:MAG: RnfABCDGE type electron transport complex subunit D [Candidatus Nomurabacteria bacterium]|nr:RnfABCDGE type electron transport complex subunit D [Candidatus Nomurabacteria bacterium]